MPFKFNALSGQFDYYEPETKLQPDDSTNAPATGKQDGYVSVAQIGADGRMYFFVEGKRYYVSGTIEEDKIDIKRGQPVGLMGVTYADDIN